MGTRFWSRLHGGDTTKARRSSFALLVSVFLIPCVSSSQTTVADASRTQFSYLTPVSTVAGESKLLEWVPIDSQLVTITSVVTSPPLRFPPSADLVDAAINPHVRLTVPPATPPGEYQIELVGRGKD